MVEYLQSTVCTSQYNHFHTACFLVGKFQAPFSSASTLHTYTQCSIDLPHSMEVNVPSLLDTGTQNTFIFFGSVNMRTYPL